MCRRRMNKLASRGRAGLHISPPLHCSSCTGGAPFLSSYDVRLYDGERRLERDELYSRNCGPCSGCGPWTPASAICRLCFGGAAAVANR
ncbi:Hypothetical protein NTJ_08756 [Nesidiocoris tenuis]|uniref:Uncharacterized protein n=1 Tax=Nesidiocoris tenuis TaxID=355587 RepID=A0ABN7AZP7_9HEMI|nr:Hypothetical protein NTJ_08756 [Nesidiocoris tenuis]